MKAFGIRLHGKRWLAHSKPPETPINPGWRPFRWCTTTYEAEKFASREAAEIFAEAVCRDPASRAIVKIAPEGPSGDGGGTSMSIAA